MSAEYRDVTTTSPDVEAKVRRWAYRQFVADNPGTHLVECPDAAMVELAGGDNHEFCRTCGWSGLMLQGVVRCPHGEESWRLDTSEADSIADILAAIDWQDYLDSLDEETGTDGDA